LVAIVVSPELTQKYQAAQKQLQDAQKANNSTQAAVIPPIVQGNLNPGFGRLNLDNVTPLPQVGTGPRSETVNQAPHPSPHVEELKREVVAAEKTASDWTETVTTLQSEVDTAEQELQAQSIPVEPLKSAVELAKAKRDKFQQLYNDGIISRAEFHQKEADLDNAQKSLATAQENTDAAQATLKVKREDLATATKSLAGAQATAAAKGKLLSDAEAAQTAPVPPPALGAGSRSALKSPVRKPFKIPMPRLAAPKIAPLGVEFSPDKHLQAETAVQQATRNLEQIAQELRACRIVSTSDGTVGEVFAPTGQSVAANAPLLSITKPSSQRIIATVSGLELAHCHYGQACLVSLNQYPKQVFKGQITRFIERGSANLPGKVEIFLPRDQALLSTLLPKTPCRVQILAG
jgi:hypothetical protein